jgi:hypothetical protein
MATKPPAIIQGMLDAAAAARTAEARGDGVGMFPIFRATDDQARAGGQHVFEGWECYCTACMTTDAFANAQEPKELC